MPIADKFALDGKIAVVTGASRNIGLAISQIFAGAGASVVMSARTASRLDAAAELVRSDSGVRVEAIACDASTVDGTDRLVTFVEDTFGYADVLVNNAYFDGDTVGTSVFDIDDASWDATYRANVLGPFRLCRGLGRGMLTRGSGSIINVLSGSGFLPSPGLMPYGASKSALWMMTRYLATELAPVIRVNGLVPGFTRGPDGKELAPGIVEHFLPLIPMGRAGLPEEVAPAALYLASDASSYTTGTVLFVNGGRPW